MSRDGLWAELKRRRVVRVGIAYAAAVFVVLQVADLTFEPLGLPGVAYTILLILSLAGFPVAVALAWAFDVTPEGVKREEAERASASRVTGRIVIAGAAVLAVGVAAWQLSRGSPPDEVEGVDPELIAVVPFRVSSADDRVTILREGVIDMLAPIFSRSPRLVDSGAMISAWRGYVEDETTDLSEAQAVELARRLGAGRVLIGSVVGSGESFVFNARLLRVPEGDGVGDAIVEGSSDGLREAIAQLARQVLSMEAGVDQGQIDYLDDVPLEALEAYLEGRRAYRGSDYQEARTAFSRALDVDSTFALAALGAREAVGMGLDADRFNLGARANRLLRANLDRLPPRDREYVRLWLGPPNRRSAMEVMRTGGQELVRRLPDKAEAWYLYGDYLVHGAWRVAEDDWFERAREAFERAAALDPGLEVVKQHKMFQIGFAGDTVGLRALAEDDARTEERSESTIVARAIMAYALGDTASLEWFGRNMETLSHAQVQSVALLGWWPNAAVPTAHLDRAFARQELTAIAEADREQALEQRYIQLRSAGRAAEADDQLRLLESGYGPRPDAWVGAYLYWDGLREPAEAAVTDLAAIVDVDSEPLLWADRAPMACMLELWRLREGDPSGVAGTVARLRAGADDPDPRHGENALCAMALETIASHRTGAPDADQLLDAYVAVLDEGPSSVLDWTSLEAAWMLEARGDLAAAARVAGYQSGSNPFPFAGSTVQHEAGRLADAASDVEKAIYRYRWYLALRPHPDERFEEEDDRIRARLTELEARAGS